MDTRELIQSIIASEEDAGDKFLESMEERISDALEVRKVELASGMMDEALKGEFEHDPDDPRASGNEMKTFQPHYYDPKGIKPKFEKPKKRTFPAGGKKLRVYGMGEEVEQVDEGKASNAQRHEYMKAYSQKTARKIPGYNAPGKDLMGNEWKAKNEEVEQVDEGDLSIRTLYNKYADHYASPYGAKRADAVGKAITKVHGPKVMSHLEKAVKANLRTDFDGEGRHFDRARTAAEKSGSDRIGATVGRGRSKFRKEEVEQANEAITDMERLRLLGDKNRAATLAAMKRYREIGDINKLSPAHRTLATRYMQSQAGSLERVSTGMQRAALKQPKQ